MSQNLLLPITQSEIKATLINTETGAIAEKVRYLVGNPKQYRFDASKGVFNVGGLDNITKPGETLKICPIAFRVFEDDILGMGKKRWFEVFFINGKSQICAVMFHGYSVQNLESCLGDLFYDDCSLLEVELSVKPVEKTSKQVDEKGKANKYYIAEFEFKILEPEDVATIKVVAENFNIYRDDTFTSSVTMLSCDGYNNPFWETLKKERECAALAQPEEQKAIAEPVA